MRAERLSVAPCLTRGMNASALMGLRAREAPPARGLAARRRSLVPDEVGRIALFSNARQAAAGREPPLLLLHGIHPSASAQDLRLVFDAFRDERRVFAPDLPGFGGSERSAREYTPELYVRAIESVIEHAAHDSRAVDVVAFGLTCEYAAQAAVHLPELVRSLALISPTGFAVKRQQGTWERAARHGRSPWLLALTERLGLSPLLFRLLISRPALRCGLRRATSAPVSRQVLHERYAMSHQPGAQHAVLALLSGSLVPRGNPQSIYTRVHRPTLILHEAAARPGFGSLELFVKWHEYFSAECVDDASLLHAASAQEVERRLRAFWQRVAARESYLPAPRGDAPVVGDLAAACGC